MPELASRLLDSSYGAILIHVRTDHTGNAEQSRGLEGALRLVGDVVAPIIRRNEEGLVDSMVRFLAFEDSQPLPIDMTAREEMAVELFHRLYEIRSSLERLDLVPFFLESRRPAGWESAGVGTSAYVQYHVEHYLHEGYVLTNRVVALLNWLRRRRREASDLIDGWKRSFSSATTGFKKLRKSHVHVKRYKDDELHRLQIAEFGISADSALARKLRSPVELLLRHEATKWAGRIRDNNRTLRDMIDAALDDLRSSLRALVLE